MIELQQYYYVRIVCEYYSYYFCADKGQKNYIFRHKLYNSKLLQSQGISRRITMVQLILVVLDDKFLG